MYQQLEVGNDAQRVVIVAPHDKTGTMHLLSFDPGFVYCRPREEAIMLQPKQSPCA